MDREMTLDEQHKALVQRRLMTKQNKTARSKGVRTPEENEKLREIYKQLYGEQKK